MVTYKRNLEHFVIFDRELHSNIPYWDTVGWNIYLEVFFYEDIYVNSQKYH